MPPSIQVTVYECMIVYEHNFIKTILMQVYILNMIEIISNILKRSHKNIYTKDHKRTQKKSNITNELYIIKSYVFICSILFYHISIIGLRKCPNHILVNPNCMLVFPISPERPMTL